MVTPPIFTMIKDLLANNVFGSVVLFTIAIIGGMGFFLLMARISFRMALVLIFPAILAVLGIGLQSSGLLGSNYFWIGALVIVALGIGVLAVIWGRISE